MIITRELIIESIERCRPDIAKKFHIDPDFEIDEESIDKFIDYINEPVEWPGRAYIEIKLP